MHSSKRKHSMADGESHSHVRENKKRRKIQKESVDVKLDKGKSKAKDSEFQVVSASLVVSVPPVFASNPRLGVEEILDSMVMRYVPAFRGVVLAHSNLHFLNRNAIIKADCPFAICNVGFDATVWSPQVGMSLSAKVNLCSPDHISLLVHRTFNVSIPRHHIPTDQWEFEYGPIEDGHEVPQNADVDSDVSVERYDGEGSGRWIHRVTGDRLGGEDSRLEFVVIGLTVANEMLSLIGSIQSDPFSPEHVPQAAPTNHIPLTDSEEDHDRTAVNESQGTAIDEDVDMDEDVFLVPTKKSASTNEAKRKKELDMEGKEKRKKRKKSKTQDEPEGMEEESHTRQKKQ